MTKPLLQVAIDARNLDEAVAIVKKVQSVVDVVEAGTPLVKTEGLKHILPAFKKLTDKPLVADLKAADVADLEFEQAKKYGASYVTVLGASPIENVQDALSSAKELGLNLVADLIGVENYCQKAKQLVEMGIEYIGLHCGISEQRQGKTIFQKTKEVSDAIAPLGGKIVVAGGITVDNVHNLAGISNIAVIISGGGITGSADPYEAAKKLQEKIGEIF